MYRITSPHRYNRYLYPTAAGGNVYAADSVYDALTQRGRRLWWDADGNLSREYYRYRPSLGEEERMERRLCHTEEGMMQGYWQESVDRYRSETVAAWYAYDADGHRALKYASERAAGSAQSVVELCDPVYYVSPLVTLTRTGYSKHYFEGGRRICTVIGGGFAHRMSQPPRKKHSPSPLLFPWSGRLQGRRLASPPALLTSDPMPVVGPHDDKLAKVLLMGAESTFNDCIEVRAYLSNTETLYKMMQNESERYETHEPAFYYHTERCRSREQSHACMSYAETRQRVRSQHLGSTAKCFVYNVSQAKTLPESGYFLRFGSEVHWTSSSYGEDCRRVQIQYLDGQTKKSNTSQAKALSCKWELAGLWFGRPQAFLLYSDTNHIGIYQFNGKERDFESGFYYYGARYHWPELLTGWTTPDPLMDKYPGISPYNYCNWNPVIFVDPDGMEINPVYDFNGSFLGNTKEGFTGEPIISCPNALSRCMEFYEVSDVSELSMEQVLCGFGETFDKMEKKQNGLSTQAQEIIFTDIVSKMEGTPVYDHTFSMNDIGGSIKYYKKTKNNLGNIGTDIQKRIIYANHQYDYYETTVENIQSSVVYHEWLGHLIMGWGNGDQMSKASTGGTHYMCYLSVISSPMFNRTTNKYQDFNQKMFNYFFQ